MTTNKRPCSRAIARMTGQPWAIRPEMLSTLLAIAGREYSDPVRAAEQADLYQAGGLEDPPPSTIALIDITGPIFARADFFSDISGAATTDRITLALDDALADPMIDSIVMRFDSPGGEATGIHELANHIYSSRDVKPIVSYVSGAACSAAYWLAAATSHIFTDRTAALGSIGVVAAWTDDSAAREKQGLKDYEVVSSQSPNKRLPLESNEGRALLQAELDQYAEIFISDVARFRGATSETVMADFGRGGTLLAEPAITAGMADELSSLRDVVALLTGNDIAATTGDKTNMARFNRNNPSASARRRAEEDLPPEDIIPEDVDDQEDELPDDIQDPEDLQDDDTPEDEMAEDEETEEPIEEERDPDAEDEDEEKETKAAHKAVNRFARTHKNLYRAILRRGARRERRRIESLDDLAGPGRDKILKSAKFERPRTVSATMRSILRAEKKRRDDMQSDLRADASFSAPPAPLTKGANSAAAAEKAVIDQIVLGAETKLGVTKK